MWILQLRGYGVCMYVYFTLSVSLIPFNLYRFSLYMYNYILYLHNILLSQHSNALSSYLSVSYLQ